VNHLVSQNRVLFVSKQQNDIGYLSDERSGEQDADGRGDVGEVGDRRQQRRRLELVHLPALREGRERHQRPLKPKGRERRVQARGFVDSARLQLADRWGRTMECPT
jgi:hypothetical protein